ncbi:TPA: hypothetical protein RQL24_001525 [Vibrio vulnificus]|nr:hypothetical protein [Vibrio vulnificus]
MLKNATDFFFSQAEDIQSEIDLFVKNSVDELNSKGFVDVTYHTQHIQPGATYLFIKRLTDQLNLKSWRVTVGSGGVRLGSAASEIHLTIIGDYAELLDDEALGAWG